MVHGLFSFPEVGLGGRDGTEAEGTEDPIPVALRGLRIPSHAALVCRPDSASQQLLPSLIRIPQHQLITVSFQCHRIAIQDSHSLPAPAPLCPRSCTAPGQGGDRAGLAGREGEQKYPIMCLGMLLDLQQGQQSRAGIHCREALVPKRPGREAAKFALIL